LPMITVWPDIPKLTSILFLWICCLFSAAQLYAQNPHIQLNSEIDGERITTLVNVFKSEDFVTPQQAWLEMESNPDIGNLDFGFTSFYVLLGFSAANSSQEGDWILEIENPHINNIYFYKRDHRTQSWALLDSTGRRTSFSTRRASHFNFVLPLDLEAGESADFVVLLDKKRSSISYHTRVWNKSTFDQIQQTHYAFFGAYFGIFVLIVLASLIAFFFSNKKIYLWYLFYVLSVGLFIFTDTGLSHQYLWPDSATIGTFARIVLTYSMLLFIILFTAEYFNTKTYYPGVHQIFTILIGLVFLHGLSYLFFTEQFQNHASLMLTILYCIILVAIALAARTSIQYLKKQRNVALFFIAAFSFIFIAAFITIIAEFGIISDNLYLFTPLQIGSVFEILFLTCGLGWRVKEVNREQQELQSRINKLQNEKLKAYIEGIEEERRRLAMDLHDAIGNRLGHLKRMNEKNDLNRKNLTEEIQSIIRDVRSLSHQLSPPSIGLTGLPHSLRHLIDEINGESDISYLFQALDIPEHLNEDFSVQLYRIVQEAVQNIEKHSDASEAVIQLIGHGDQLILTIEDDGVGFSDEDNGAHKSGIGLGNIKKRVEQLNGSIEMTSQKNRGVQFLISVPYSDKAE
jgi:signal transduction histidine kinase